MPCVCLQKISRKKYNLFYSGTFSGIVGQTSESDCLTCPSQVTMSDGQRTCPCNSKKCQDPPDCWYVPVGNEKAPCKNGECQYEKCKFCAKDGACGTNFSMFFITYISLFILKFLKNVEVL